MIHTTDEQLEALIDATINYLSETAVIEKQPRAMDFAGRRLRYVLDRLETMRSGEVEIFQPTPEEYAYFKNQAGSKNLEARI
mgnify:CR=1 FL=1